VLQFPYVRESRETALPPLRGACCVKKFRTIPESGICQFQNPGILKNQKKSNFLGITR
jgi:hypothetical protein